MSISDTLNKAADLIEERGWTQGNPGMIAEADVPLCLEGALAAATGGVPVYVRLGWAGVNGHSADAFEIEDAESLREHLDSLNDAGITFAAAGMDSRQVPFLVTLHGPYAETEHVFYGSPWDGEVDYGTPRWCDECNAHSPAGLDSLAYPVVVLTTVIASAEDEL